MILAKKMRNMSTVILIDGFRLFNMHPFISLLLQGVSMKAKSGEKILKASVKACPYSLVSSMSLRIHKIRSNRLN